MKVPRLLLLVQIIFFLSWGGYLLTAFQDSQEIWLQTDPIDPRDLLSGHFVALRFNNLEHPTAQGCAGGSAADNVWVHLEASKQTIQTAQGIKGIWRITECATQSPQGQAGVWLKGQRQRERGGYRYGIERYFLPETDSRRDARSGTVVAKVLVNREHQARIIDLVETK